MSRETVDKIVADKPTLIIGVVGAFTPICTDSHINEYLPVVPILKKTRAIEQCICTAVVDPFVLSAWTSSIGGDGLIDAWADPFGEFAKSIGITADLTALGLGLRSGRYSMLIVGGEVQKLNIEEDPTIVTVSGANLIMEQLGVYQRLSLTPFLVGSLPAQPLSTRH